MQARREVTRAQKEHRLKSLWQTADRENLFFTETARVSSNISRHGKKKSAILNVRLDLHRPRTLISFYGRNKHWFLLKCHIWQHSIMSISGTLTTRRHPILNQVSSPLAQSASTVCCWADPNTTLIENTTVLFHHRNKGRQGRQQRGQTGLELTHLDPDARQHLTAKITTVLFRILSSAVSPDKDPDKTVHVTTDPHTISCK